MDKHEYTSPVSADDLAALRGHFEIHCEPLPIPRSLALEIRRAGGKYTECRGHYDRRFVDIPLGCDELADRVIRELGKGPRVVVIVRAPELNRCGGTVNVTSIPRDRPEPSRLALTTVAQAVTRYRTERRPLFTDPLTAAEVDHHLGRERAQREAEAARRSEAASDLVAALGKMRPSEQRAFFEAHALGVEELARLARKAVLS